MNFSCEFCKCSTNLINCLRCKSVWYCSEICQKKHWLHHKLTCKKEKEILDMTKLFWCAILHNNALQATAVKYMKKLDDTKACYINFLCKPLNRKNLFIPTFNYLTSDKFVAKKYRKETSPMTFEDAVIFTTMNKSGIIHIGIAMFIASFLNDSHNILTHNNQRIIQVAVGDVHLERKYKSAKKRIRVFHPINSKEKMDFEEQYYNHCVILFKTEDQSVYYLDMTGFQYGIPGNLSNDKFVSIAEVEKLECFNLDVRQSVYAPLDHFTIYSINPQKDRYSAFDEITTPWSNQITSCIKEIFCSDPWKHNLQ